MSRIGRAIETLLSSPEEIARRRLNFLIENKGLRYFDRIELDLGDSRTLKEYEVFGDVLVVESIDGEADCYFNEKESDYIELDKTRKVYMDFWRIFITNAAQAGKTCVLLAGRQGTFDGVSDVARQSTLDEINSKTGTGISVSDDVLISSDAEKQRAGSGYSPQKVIGLTIDGFYRITFELKEDDGAPNHALAKIYKNGVAYGTERDTTEMVYQNYSEDLWFNEGDTVELWLSNSEAMGHCTCKEFRIKGTFGLTYGSVIS